MSLSVRELNAIERSSAEAARRERILRRAVGADTLGVLSRSRAFTPYVFDITRQMRELTQPPWVYTALITPNPALEAVKAMNAITGVELTKTMSAINQLAGVGDAIKAVNMFAGVDFAKLGLHDVGRTAALARYWRRQDTFASLTRGFDVLGANRAFASYVEAMNATTQNLFGSYVRSLETIISRPAVDAMTAARAFAMPNPLVFANVADVLRVHDLLRERIVDSGVELSWDEVYGEALRELAEWLRQPTDRAELERRSYVVGVAYGTVQAADAFAQGNVPLGVAHTMFALWCLQQYWELRRLQ
jgi:hypothetical protein